jgi:hypothetical protein
VLASERAAGRSCKRMQQGTLVRHKKKTYAVQFASSSTVDLRSANGKVLYGIPLDGVEVLSESMTVEVLQRRERERACRVRPSRCAKHTVTFVLAALSATIWIFTFNLPVSELNKELAASNGTCAVRLRRTNGNCPNECLRCGWSGEFPFRGGVCYSPADSTRCQPAFWPLAGVGFVMSIITIAACAGCRLIPSWCVRPCRSVAESCCGLDLSDDPTRPFDRVADRLGAPPPPQEAPGPPCARCDGDHPTCECPHYKQPAYGGRGIGHHNPPSVGGQVARRHRGTSSSTTGCPGSTRENNGARALRRCRCRVDGSDGRGLPARREDASPIHASPHALARPYTLQPTRHGSGIPKDPYIHR